MRLNLNTTSELPTAEQSDEARLAAELRKCQAQETKAIVQQARCHLDALKKPKRERSEAEIAEHRENRNLPTDILLNRLKTDCPEAFAAAKVVGVWVWLQFAQKPERAVLDKLYSLGFHWNFQRKCWQHPCGAHSPHSKGDPRAKYGVAPAGTITSATDGEDIILTDLSPRLQKIVAAVNNGSVLA